MYENCELERSFESVCDILNENEYDKTRLVPILQGVQKIYRYLPQEVLNYVANSLSITPAEVFGVATFYGHFALKPKGKYVVKICNGTACHVKGSMKLYDAIKTRLALPEGKKTSSDMLFTIETVSCLGACGLAPAVVINEDVHGQVLAKESVKLIDDIVKIETSTDARTGGE